MQDPSNAQPPQYPPNAQPPQYPPNAQPPQYPPNTQPPQYPPNAQPPQYPSYPTYPPTQLGAPPLSSGDAYPAYSTQPPPPYPPPTQYQPQPYPPYGAGYPPPPRKTQPWIWAIVGVVAAIVIVGAIVAVAAANNRPGVVNNPPATQQATGAPTQADQPTTAPTQGSSSSSSGHKIGDVVVLDGWQVVVNGAKISHGGQFDTPQHTGDVFLEIDVAVTNQTGQSQPFSSDLSFTLKDSTGQKYNQTFVSDAPSSPDGDVQSGGKLRGTISYEVAPTMKSFELDFSPSLANSDLATWNLSVS